MELTKDGADLNEKSRQIFKNGQTTDWVGRTVAMLLDDPDIISKGGRVIWCHDVSFKLNLNFVLRIIIQIADAHGITDNDGTIVPSIRK